jgi:hypothetical protein
MSHPLQEGESARSWYKMYACEKLNRGGHCAQ